MNNAEIFIENFRSFGAAPDPVRYEALFDPAEGTVLHPGMTEPLTYTQVREYMERYLATIKDFHFEILSWAEKDGTVFIEAKSSGVVAGEYLTWGIAYCITLKGSRVKKGRAYADRIPILARMFPDMTLRDIAGISGPAPGLVKGK
jgi:hypothetical protein